MADETNLTGVPADQEMNDQDDDQLLGEDETDEEDTTVAEKGD